MALQHWPPSASPSRGRVLLVHGLSSMAESWWRIGPALSREGWDVTAVDQAGHGGRPLRGEATPEALARAVRELHPDGPDVLIGHSLGTVTVLALLGADPAWARTVILEEPASALSSQVCLGIAASIVSDVAAVREDPAAVRGRIRRDCPRWADEDVHWAVEGIARMDPAPFARRFAALAREAQSPAPDRILAAAPTAHVLAGVTDRPFAAGGSVLSGADRVELARRLPAGHVRTLDGGHCLHRDVPEEWLAAVRSVLA